MRNLASLNYKNFNFLLVASIGFLLTIGCSMFSGGGTSSGDKGGTGWKVWVKTSPCSGGRTDWISVAKQNPGEGGGGSFFSTADMLTSGLSCIKTSDNSCTFAQAMDVANTVRSSSRFTEYCCKDYSVWGNSQTRDMSIVKGPGSPGFGWQFEKGNLCCEEAESFAGKPGLCSGPALGSNGRGGGPQPPRLGNQGGNQINDGVTPTPYTTPLQTPVSTPLSTPLQTQTPLNARWKLVSITAVPATPPQGYSYTAQSTSVRLDSSNGDWHYFQWSLPPAQFDTNGFTISANIQCKSQPNNRCASLMNIRGDGLESDTPSGDRKAEAYGENGAIGRGTKTVVFKPSPSSNEIEVEIGLMWGAVRFQYKYRRDP